MSLTTTNLLTLNSSKTEFLLIGLKQQLSKIQDCSLTTTHSTRNLGFIFNEHLTFSDQITALSKSCYYHIRELRCVCPYCDFKTASTIATFIVHSKLDYYSSVYHNLANCQLNRLQQIQNSLARAVVKAPKSTYITPILKSLHWLKVNERIEYKLFSLTEFLQPLNLAIFTTLSLFNLLAVPAPHLLSLFLATNHLLLENHRSLI